jgi:hypothetical protein
VASFLGPTVARQRPAIASLPLETRRRRGGSCRWLESFLVRRMACGLTTRSYSLIFVKELAEVADQNPVAPALREALLTSKHDPMRWVGDEEFPRSRGAPASRRMP